MAQVMALDAALLFKQLESPARNGVIQVFDSFSATFDLGRLHRWDGWRGLHSSCGLLRHRGTPFVHKSWVLGGDCFTRPVGSGLEISPLTFSNNTIRLQLHVIFFTVRNDVPF